MQQLVNEKAGSPIDHVGIGVRDTCEGVALLQQITGVKPELGEPEPGQFYWSGSLSLGANRFLEILGPNPEFRGFNPFMEIVKTFERPRPVFWYVGTSDFEKFAAEAKKLGAPVGRIQTVQFDRAGERVDYTRGIVGPGFNSARPCVIQWRMTPPSNRQDDGRIKLKRLRLASPDAAAINNAFTGLGIRQHVIEGNEFIGVDLDTPNGEVEIEGPGLTLRGPSSMLLMGRLLARFVGRKLVG